MAASERLAEVVGKEKEKEKEGKRPAILIYNIVNASSKSSKQHPSNP